MKKRNKQEEYQLGHLTSRQLLELYRRLTLYDMSDGKQILNYMLNLECQDAERYFEKAVVLYEIHRIGSALEACDKAIELKPDFAAAYALKAKIILHISQQYEEAIKAYDKVIELNPDFQDVYLDKGWCLTEIGRHEEAIECFNIGINRDEYSEELYMSKGYVLLQQLKRKDEDALQAYSKAIKLSPDKAFYYSAAGQILKALGRQEEAKAMLNKAIELAPNMEGCISYCFENDDIWTMWKQ